MKNFRQGKIKSIIESKVIETQEELARKMQFMGMEMTPLIISRIEKNQRHVCDAELRMIAKALNVSMNRLCGDSNEIKL